MYEGWEGSRPEPEAGLGRGVFEEGVWQFAVCAQAENTRRWKDLGTRMWAELGLTQGSLARFHTSTLPRSANHRRLCPPTSIHPGRSANATAVTGEGGGRLPNGTARLPVAEPCHCRRRKSLCPLPTAHAQHKSHRQNIDFSMSCPGLGETSTLPADGRYR